jgi:hypothetical protein
MFTFLLLAQLFVPQPTMLTAEYHAEMAANAVGDMAWLQLTRQPQPTDFDRVRFHNLAKYAAGIGYPSLSQNPPLMLQDPQYIGNAGYVPPVDLQERCQAAAELRQMVNQTLRAYGY